MQLMQTNLYENFVPPRDEIEGRVGKGEFHP